MEPFISDRRADRAVLYAAASAFPAVAASGPRFGCCGLRASAQGRKARRMTCQLGCGDAGRRLR